MLARRSASDGECLLQVRQLSVARGDRDIVTDFSLSLGRGTRCLLRGANGAGKTSLLEALAGLREPSGGAIVQRAGIVWVGHRNALNPALSAQENLAFWCELHGAPKAQAPDALKRMGLIGRTRSRPSRGLSTGQKRRAALARLLLSPAPLWLIDEPLAGLDVDAIPLFAELLSEHEARGGAVLLTTHQPLPDPVAPHTVVDL